MPCLLFLCFITVAKAQNIRLKLNVAHTTYTGYRGYLRNLPYKFEDVTGYYTIDKETQKRTAELKFNFNQPQEFIIYFAAGKDAEGINYHFLLSPGDDIVFDIDFQKKDNGIVVTGKGSSNNQPMLLGLQSAEIQHLYNLKDSLPYKVIAEINKVKPGNKKLIDAYIAKYHPTPEFVKYSRYNLAYDDATTYFSFKENNKFAIRNAYNRNKAKWDKVQDSLLTNLRAELKLYFPAAKGVTIGDKASVKNIAGKQVQILNNDDALIADSYRSFLRDFLLREKERLWTEADEQPVKFYKEWYNADTTAGKKLFLDDQQNLLKEKIINKNFTGHTAEFLYAELLQEADDESNPQNVVAIFNRFKAKYPQSPYINQYAADVDAVKAKQQMGLTNQMIFAADNGKNLNTLQDVLALTKGKTVLVDMWGTWCSPCRAEISKNSAAIKEHFKDKGLDYLYVANYDTHNETNWKKLIAYFHLEGLHIMAGEKLSGDIMKTVKGNGYPTYFIIKKDGSYELSKAGYPMKQDVLIKQLEAALAM